MYVHYVVVVAIVLHVPSPPAAREVTGLSKWTMQKQ